MKKYLCTLALVGLVSSAFAQGVGQINLVSGSNLVRSTGDAGATPAVGVNGGFVQLLWAPQGTAVATPWTAEVGSLAAWLTANPGWQAVDTSIKAINGPVAGRFSAGTIEVPTTATIQAAVAAWLGNFTSFDLALAAPNGQAGISDAFTITPGNPNATPIPELPATTSGLFPGVTTTPVIPEPSSFALLGLGAAALLAFRRRQ